MDSSDDAIISKGLHGLIATWNRAAARLPGSSEAEAVGQPITLIIPDDVDWDTRGARPVVTLLWVREDGKWKIASYQPFNQ